MSGLLLGVILPLFIGALLTILTPKKMNALTRVIAIAASLVSLVFIMNGYVHFHAGPGTYEYEWDRVWFAFPFAYLKAPLAIHFRFAVDGLSMPFIALTGIVSLLSILASGSVKQREKQYYFWMQLLSGGLLTLFASLDLLVFFLALEVTLVSTYFLLLLWGSEDRRRVSTKFLIYRGLASIGILLTFLGIVYAAAFVNDYATTDIPSIVHTFNSIGPDQISMGLRNALFFTLLVAVLIEEALVPFHTWLPDSLSAANTPVGMMIGGVLVKTGAYLLIRIGLGVLPDPLVYFSWWLALIGVINIIYAGLIAVVQKDWRRLIAYSTISHMGVVLIGIAAATPAGIEGAIFMTLSSALLSALLLFIVGTIRERTQSDLIESYGGLSKSIPILSGVLLTAALGSLGLPGMSGFISEILSFTGSFRHFPALSAIGVFGMILSALYLLWAIQRTTFGPRTIAPTPILWDARPLDYVPIVVLLCIVIGIGVYPSVLGHVVNQVVNTLTSTTSGLEATTYGYAG